MKGPTRKLLLLLFCFPGIGFYGLAQNPLPPQSSADLLHALQKLQVLGSVLYVAAHPDDENQQVLAYFEGERKYRAAYLSLTRGDGGQNLIGDEIGPSLGMLRTQELLAARRIDGAEQWFSRALDFGYSKIPTETLNVWDREAVLADMVWVIRKFRPDVIITRFSPDRAGKTHGHHTTSAILAEEAFSLAADPQAFPEQLAHASPWQPKRLLWNTWLPHYDSGYDFSETLSLDVGGFNPLLGKSYGEIAADARSMHKCQAFGAAKQRGEDIEYLRHLAGDLAEQDVFEGINTSWSRVAGGKAVGKLLEEALQAFDPLNPTGVLPHLLRARQALRKLPDGYWKKQKLAELTSVISHCAGLWYEANSASPGTAVGDSVKLTFSVLKRSALPLQLTGIDLWVAGEKMPLELEASLAENELWQHSYAFALTQDVAPSQPYWLEQPATKGMFRVDDQRLIGLPESPDPLEADFHFTFEGHSFTFRQPVIHKYVNPAMGELYRPFLILPSLTTTLGEPIYLFADDRAQRIDLTIKAHKGGLAGQLRFDLPQGWEVTPATMDVKFEKAGEEQQASISVRPPAGQSEGELKVVFVEGGKETTYSLQTIAYDHIPTQLIFNPSVSRLVKVDLKTAGTRIGYIMGSGDELPACLRQVGYEVDLLEDEDLKADNLEKYDAVIAGIRLYNVNPRMPYLQNEIFDYVKAGGTYLVQYNTTRSLSTQQPAPYPLKVSRDRVSVEEAPIKLLQPEHPAFHFPNQITQKDFDGWVQERGLYFPDEWDDRYQALIECNDPGESPKQGALLVAEHGEGHFVYSGLSWFRELPAGVPGAYRLLVNLLSLGHAPQSADR